jgi:hypothetical protein
MIKPVMTKFPRDGNLKPLLRLIEEELDGKVLVTSIINCPAYGFVVNRGKNQSVTISLSLAAPPFAPVPITAGGGGEISLVNQSTSGSWKVGSTVGCTYTPLFELSILKRWWGLSGNQPTTKRNQLTVFNPKDDEEPFSPYMAPWGVLDDDGEEVTEEVSPSLVLGEPLTRSICRLSKRGVPHFCDSSTSFAPVNYRLVHILSS